MTGRVLLSAQGGSTAYDKLQSAFGAAGAGDTVVNDLGRVIVDRGTGSEIVVPDGVHLDGRGQLKFQTATLNANLLRFATDGNDMGVRGCIFDGAASSAALKAAGACGIEIERCEFVNGTNYGVDVASNGQNRAAGDVRIRRNKFWKYANGIIFPLIVRAGSGGLYVQGAVIEGNWLFGTDPANPANGDHDGTGPYCADQIVLQGVEDFSVLFNRSMWSGSAGLSITNGSRNGVVNGNLFEVCQEPGFNLGAGWEAFETASDLTNWDSEAVSGNVYNITSSAGITNGVCTAIIYADPDDKTLGGTLWIRSISGNAFISSGDTVTQATTGATAVASADSRKSLENCDTLDNMAIDCSIQAEGAAFSAYRMIGHNTFHGNGYANPRGLGQAKALLSKTHSFIGESDNATEWPDQFTEAGLGAWLYRGKALGLRPGTGPDLVIAGGSITPTHRQHRIDTEGAAATDDLIAINPANMLPGDVLTLNTITATRVVTVKDGTSIKMAGDFAMNGRHDTFMCAYSTTLAAMCEISRSDNN